MTGMGHAAAPVIELSPCLGRQAFSARFLRDRTRLGVQADLLVVGRLILTDDVTAEDVRSAIGRQLVIGRIDGPRDAVRQLRRQRGIPRLRSRRNRTLILRHDEELVGEVTRVRCKGVVWYDAYELRQCIALGQKVDLDVQGALVFARDVTAELVSRAFSRGVVRGMLFGPEGAKRALLALEGSTVTRRSQ